MFRALWIQDNLQDVHSSFHPAVRSRIGLSRREDPFPPFFFFKDLFIIIHKYTVAVFRHTEEGVRSHYGWL